MKKKRRCEEQIRRVEKEEYKKQQNAYRLARCPPPSSRPVLLCTRRLEEARSARASLQAQLEAEEETRGEARQEEFGSMVCRGKELLERVYAEGTRGGRAGRVARDGGAAGAGGREEALAARVGVRRLEEELARVPSTGTKEGAAAARAALLEAAVAELRREQDEARHSGAEDQEELSPQAGVPPELAHEAEKEGLRKEAENESSGQSAERTGE